MFKQILKEDLMHRGQFDTLDNDCGSTVKNYTSNEVVWFGRFEKVAERDASGICSPPLWKTSNPHCQNLTNYSQLSAAAKAQAVTRGQEELMEMISNMPESSYELSLKDIVEQNNLKQVETQMPRKGTEEDHTQNGNPHSHFTQVFTKRKSDAKMKRSGSLNDGGFLLKIVFPRLKGNKRASSKFSARSSSVRSWDVLPWFGENESSGRQRTSTSNTIKSNIKPFGSRRSSSENNNRGQPNGTFITGCWSVFSFKKTYNDDE